MYGGMTTLHNGHPTHPWVEATARAIIDREVAFLADLAEEEGGVYECSKGDMEWVNAHIEAKMGRPMTPAEVLYFIQA